MPASSANVMHSVMSLFVIARRAMPRRIRLALWSPWFTPRNWFWLLFFWCFNKEQLLLLYHESSRFYHDAIPNSTMYQCPQLPLHQPIFNNKTKLDSIKTESNRIKLNKRTVRNACLITSVVCRSLSVPAITFSRWSIDVTFVICYWNKNLWIKSCFYC